MTETPPQRSRNQTGRDENILDDPAYDDLDILTQGDPEDIARLLDRAGLRF